MFETLEELKKEFPVGKIIKEEKVDNTYHLTFYNETDLEVYRKKYKYIIEIDYRNNIVIVRDIYIKRWIIEGYIYMVDEGWSPIIYNNGCINIITQEDIDNNFEYLYANKIIKL